MKTNLKDKRKEGEKRGGGRRKGNMGDKDEEEIG